MVGWLKLIQARLQGKKTYLLAAAIVVVTAALVLLGKLTPDVALAAMLFGFAGFAMTFRAALSRHQREALGVLTDIAAVGVAARSHNQPAEVAAAKAAVSDATALGQAICEESSQ